MTQDSTQNKVNQILENITGLPTLPTVITQVTKLMQNPKVSATEVGQAISSDQALAAKILKVVNSPFYGFPSRIKTITHAIVILGFNAVRATALSTSVFSSFNPQGANQQFDREGFWKFSLGVGSAARVLGKRLHMKETEEVFLAGLLHDIGIIILDEFMHADFKKILSLMQEKKILMEDACKVVLDGVTFHQLGAGLAKKWNLNDELVQTILNYPRPTAASSHFQFQSIIHVADFLVRCMEYGYSGDVVLPKVNPSAWKQFNIVTASLPELLTEISAEFEKSEVFFNILQ